MPATQESHITSDTEPTSTTMHQAAPPVVHAPPMLELTASVSRRPPTTIFSRAPSMEAAYSGQGRIVHTSLEALEKEMEVFLRNHIAKLLLLQESLPLKENGNPIRDTEALNTIHNGAKRASVQPGQPSLSEKNKFGGTLNDIPNNLTSHKHANRLESFLEKHIMTLQNLRNGLLVQFPADSTETEDKSKSLEFNKAFESVGSQFTMQVVISTFASSLIISFVSLADSMVDSHHKTTFSVGKMLSLFAVSVHLANIIVAGRGAALATENSIDPDTKYHNVQYFRFYLILCEQLQFFATLLFVISVAVLVFVMFSNVAWAVVVIWFAVILAFGVFCLGYWKVSMTSRNVRYLMGLGGRGYKAFKKGMWGT